MAEAPGRARVYERGGAHRADLARRGEDAGSLASSDGAELIAGAHLRVGLISDVYGIDAYSRGAFLGIERATRELGIKGRVLTPAPKEGHAPSLILFAQQGYDLVLATGFFTAAAVDAVAQRYPAARFGILDVAHEALPHRPPNVQGIVFSDDEAGCLAGYLAALVLTPSVGENVISSVGGRPVPAVERYIAGFEAGARLADPHITVLNGYTDDFLDRVKGKSVAVSQIARGSKVVFQVAGICGLGVLEAAKEHGIWGIGVDVDQSELGPHVLTSAVKRLDVAVFSTIEQLAQGTFETGSTTRFSLQNGGVGLGAVSDRVPAAVVARVAELEAEIVAGKVEIPIK
jgi:basic membrane protein A